MDYPDHDTDTSLSIDRKVAIVGIGCRYPGDIKTPQDFWETIKDGIDCTSPHPPERLHPSYICHGERIPGKIYTTAAGYLSQNVEEFDRELFKISPEEVRHMDPQLRHILEVSWEAFEDYGVNMRELAESPTGVYIGVMVREYMVLLSLPDDNIGQYSASGNNSNMISNRISYQFALQGPSMTFDTACSSSMYAIYHACEAIRHGECNLAIAGGVNLMLLPATTISICQARMLSKDGKCKSFDNGADGYSRGEGVGLVVLKSLRMALDDGDRIYAVIRGGAINNDGRTNGITSPNVDAQISLLKRAYEIAKVVPQEVPYVEAHGTGTQAGDTTEANALGRVLGIGRDDHNPPLIVGSVKANFGHTEAAAGVASVIKVCLVLQNKQIPKLVHFNTKNENIQWRNFDITFPTNLLKWPENSNYFAGCSSFGFGGANAHLVLEAPPNCRKLLSRRNGSKNNVYPTILFLSAASANALNQRLYDWVDFLKNIGDDIDTLYNALQTAAKRATHQEHRVAVICESYQQTIDVLEKRDGHIFIEGRVQTMYNGRTHQLAFVFSGMGTQWWAMGRQLMETDEIFRNCIVEIDKLLTGFGATWSLNDLLTVERDKEKIHSTDIAQPAICAIQISLTAVYRHLGIHPDVVIGHSVGEVAAAYVAGYLSLSDAVRLIYVRGKSLQKTSGNGKMAAILSPVRVVREVISDPKYEGRVDIACVNSPSQTVISGEGDDIDQVIQILELQGIRCIKLSVQNAFHSFQQEEIKQYFLEHTQFLRRPKFHLKPKFTPIHVKMLSTVNGQYLNASILNTNTYWWNNIRQTVKFEDTLVRLFKGGCNVILEIGPHPSLASPIKSTMVSFSEQSGVSFHEQFAVIPSLRRPLDTTQKAADKINILMSVAKLYIQGFPVDMDLIIQAEGFCVTSIPKYPWQRQLYSAVTDSAKQAYIDPKYYHPLLGEQVVTFSETQQDCPHKDWTSNYNRLVCPWLHHHKIQNAIVLPGAAFIEIMLRAASTESGSPGVINLKNIQFHKFHYSPNCEGVLYTSLSQIGERENKNICIRTRNEIDNSWTLHATCDLDFSTETHTLTHERYLDVDEVKGRCKKKLPSGSLYNKLHGDGVQIGDMFASVTSAYYSANNQEALVFASLPMAIESESQLYTFHPALLDCIFQLFAGFAVFNIDTLSSHGNVELPKAVRSFRMLGKASTDIVIHAQKHFERTHEVRKVLISDLESGKIFAELDGVVLATVNAKDDGGSIRWEKQWVPVDWKESIPMLVEESALLKENEYFLISDGQGVTEKLMTLLHTIDITTHVHVSNHTADANMPVSRDSNASSRHIVFMHMINECSSLSEIKRETFIDSQINKSISCIETTINTFAEHTETTYLWIVTKGAVVACPSDNMINPLMSNAFALVLTFMHEHPEIHIGALDLPHDLHPNDCALWLSYFLKRPIISENCLALRLNNGYCKINELNIKAYSLRLTTKATSELVISKSSYQWMINLEDIKQKGSAKCIKPWHENSILGEDDLGPTVSKQIVVEAYIQQPYKNLDDITRSRSGFLFAGKVSSFHPATDCKEATPAFMGYCRSHIVMSVLKNISHIVPLPLNVSPVDALATIASCLPLYVAIKDSLQMFDHHIVLLTSSYDPLHVRLAKLLSDSTSCKIIVCVSDVGNLNQTDNVISQGKLSCVLNSTVDTLILHPHVKLDNKDVTILLEKIRVFGKIVTFSSIPWKHPLIIQQQIHVKMIDMEILRSDDHHQIMNSLVTSLLKLFFEDGSNYDSSCDSSADVVNINDANGNQLCGESIVWTSPAMPVEVSYRLPDFISTFKADANASYLVVGGTKGLGFEIARWLATHGAKMVYISGRSAPKGDIDTEIKSLNNSMHNLEFIKCDASEENQTLKMLTRIKECSASPLRGIFHCAAAFADQQLKDATYEDWHKVLLPKAYGALLLHQITQTLDIKLSEFVVFSSIVEFLGSSGQASYCCANAFLTSLCQARRLEGLPSTVIAPGAVSKVGIAAREGFVRMFEARGIHSISPTDVIMSLAWSNATNEMMFGMTGLLDKQLYVKTNPIFEQILQNHFSIYKKEFSREQLEKFTDNTQNTFSTSEITEFFIEFLENRLGVTESVSTETSLGFYGLDSAMSWELSALIISRYNVAVSVVELLNESLKISDVAKLLHDRATGEENGALRENIERVNTDSSILWLQNLSQLENANTDIICFPCTGMGTTMFEQWVEGFALDDMCLTVTQLPGWEGRMSEKPSHNLEFLVQNISSCILANFQPNRVSFVGCGIGALLALEVALRLQTQDEFHIRHIFVIGWYPPSSPYPAKIVYDEQAKTNFGKSNTEKQTLTFLDNRDLKQVQIFRKAYQNVQASKAICKQYKRMSDCRLLCNMTVFTGSKDQILSKKLVSKWKDEIYADQIFHNVQLKADHKLFRNKKINMKIASIIRNNMLTMSRSTHI